MKNASIANFCCTLLVSFLFYSFFHIGWCCELFFLLLLSLIRSLVPAYFLDENIWKCNEMEKRSKLNPLIFLV